MLLVAWTQNVDIKQIKKTAFCVELRVGCEARGANFWIVFVYASPEARIMKQQWDYLKARKKCLGTSMATRRGP